MKIKVQVWQSAKGLSLKDMMKIVLTAKGDVIYTNKGNDVYLVYTLDN